MTEEAKELINCIRVNLRHNKCFGGIDEIGCKILLDCITNLQQEKSDICKNRLAIAIEKDRLQQENERLKEENKRIFSKVNDDKLLISNAMNYAEAQDYKSRLEKASNKLDSMFANGEENKILDDLLELDKIVKGDKQ